MLSLRVLCRYFLVMITYCKVLNRFFQQECQYVLDFHYCFILISVADEIDLSIGGTYRLAVPSAASHDDAVKGMQFGNALTFLHEVKVTEPLLPDLLNV